MWTPHGIVNLSKSGLVEGVTTRPKLLKVRPGPWVGIPQSRANPVKLMSWMAPSTSVRHARIGMSKNRRGATHHV
jgi:hypothetical protein